MKFLLLLLLFFKEGREEGREPDLVMKTMGILKYCNNIVKERYSCDCINKPYFACAAGKIIGYIDTYTTFFYDITYM